MHVDLYRLERVELDDLGLRPELADAGVVAVEWAERLARPIAGAIGVTIRDRRRRRAAHRDRAAGLVPSRLVPSAQSPASYSMR